MNSIRTLLPLLLVFLTLSSARTAAANVVVVMQTVFGPIELELFDAVAPLTVANFLGYADSGAYDTSIIHRSDPGFVIQGGGSKVVGAQIDFLLTTTPPTVQNEPGLSNVRGTVAMAKIGGQPNSATTQWFINMGDNLFLNTDNGGYTVFADVIAGLPVADAINALLRVNIGGGINELPFFGWNPSDPNDMLTVNDLVQLPDVARRTSPLCGDLNADTQINALDVARLRSALANPTGSALSAAEATRCSVVGTTTDCNLVDSTIVRRRLAGRSPKRQQICPAAL